MADPHAKPHSPISQVLQSLGLTREDLLRHSDQMRQFLTAEDANSLRVLTREISGGESSSLIATRMRSLSRSTSGANASSTRESPPPTPLTPIKAEPNDSGLPLRTMDSMEMVIERKSRQSKRDRKERKNRDRNSIHALPPSPSPSSTSFSLDSFMHARDGRRVSDLEGSDTVQSDSPVLDTVIPPVTPQKRKYYRDDTVNDTSSVPVSESQDTFSPGRESPTPTRYRTRTLPPQKAASFTIPETPKRLKNYYKSPLPRSSPPPQSSPFSSPTKPVLNLVSSPGPMGPLPSESDYDHLPYTLPPGPYATKKPEISYAALIGRAILSSPKHALTLQEIYDWITIVHPHFKRGETTWMNSIRHVLSTTACFRKHTRERSAGRTLWVIWDCDLECFKNGGFNKQHCKDMSVGTRKPSINTRKRAADDTGERKSKRPRKSAVAIVEREALEAAAAAASLQSTILPPLIPASQLHPLFPSTGPKPHIQGYYDSCMNQPPTEVIFPPLPNSGFHRMASGASTSSASTSYSQSSHASEPPSSVTSHSEWHCSSPPPMLAPSSSASMSMPDLTPNGSSSSPLMSSEDHMDVEDSSPILYTVEDEDDKLFREILSTDALEPGFMLNKHDYYQPISKGKGRAHTPPRRSSTLPPAAPSPSLSRRAKGKIPVSPSKGNRLPLFPSASSPPLRPTTPPRNASSLQHLKLSPVRTPISHRGVHMSPSVSLTHYKSNLDPPPPMPSSAFTGLDNTDSDNSRTPTRKRTSLGTPLNSIFPMTPKKLFAPPNPSYSQDSPFRTPGTRGMFDPHDPGALLDEELSRLGAQMGAQDSPSGGLYEGRKGLLYESPSMPSPGKWTRWW